MCLFEVMVNVNKQILLDFDTDLKESLTISSLAANMFMNNCYRNNIPDVNKASIYKDLKNGYYGGISEVYKPFGVNLNYLDFNSLYPFVAHQALPVLKCEKITYYKPTQGVDYLFGCFYCKIK